VQLRQLADFAVVVEALRSLSPDAIGVAEEESAVVAGRTLRVKLASQPALDLGTAVCLAQWYASSPVPSSSAAKQCCDNLSAKVELLDALRLRRSIIAALQAAIGPTASIWIPLLRDLLKELRRKTYLQRAEDLLRLTTHFLKAASAASAASARKRPKRYPNPLQLVGRAGALIVMKRLVKHKALLSQVSTSALQETLAVTSNLSRKRDKRRTKVQNFGEHVLTMPPALLPDSLPWVVTTAFPKADLDLGLLPFERSGCFLGRCSCGHQRMCSQFMQDLQYQAVFRMAPRDRTIRQKRGLQRSPFTFSSHPIMCSTFS